MKAEILYQDTDIIVCKKPCKVPTQSDKSHDEDMVSILKNYIFEQEKREKEPEIYVVHRLDRPVSGVMVFAQTKKAAARLSEQMQNGEFEKNYQAILTGELKEEQGTLIDYLVKDSKTNKSKVVSKDTKGAKRAELNYEVLDVIETEEGVFSYVLIELVTGRHHQIRVQFSSRNTGIWGDTKYNPLFTKTQKVYKQIGLCSTRIAFSHPSTGEKMSFKMEADGEAFELMDTQEY